MALCERGFQSIRSIVPVRSILSIVSTVSIVSIVSTVSIIGWISGHSQCPGIRVNTNSLQAQLLPEFSGLCWVAGAKFA